MGRHVGTVSGKVRECTKGTLCEKKDGASRLRKHRDDEGRFKILKN